MRIPSWLLCIIGFSTLAILTGICSLGTFAMSRNTVIDMWESGQQVYSLDGIAKAFLHPEDFEAPSTATPFDAQSGIIISSFTPIATVAATQEESNSASDMRTDASEIEENTTEQPINEAQEEATAIPGAAEVAELGPREINILLMGIDERVGYTSELAYRTDTMMVVHIDPIRKTAGVISFPRDLWVSIPGYNEASRINRANYVGDLNAYPNGAGPGLAMETINANFGIRVDYYVMVNFTVFETVVDIIAPDGVEVCVNETIRDEKYPDEGFGEIFVSFDPGCHRMNGQRLLQYARTRATENSDLDRARRQQQAIEALRTHILSAGSIQAFISNIPHLWNELSGSYRTNLTIPQIVGLGYLMSEIDTINYNVIDFGYVQPGQTQDGTQQILIPIHSRIQELIAETFYPQIETTVDLRTRAEAENATVQVYNGTQISGLASRTQEYLLSRGVRVSGTGNATDHNGAATVIRNYGGGRDTALWIADILGLPPEHIEIGSDGLVTHGVVVIVGPDIEQIIASDRE